MAWQITVFGWSIVQQVKPILDGKNSINKYKYLKYTFSIFFHIIFHNSLQTWAPQFRLS